MKILYIDTSSSFLYAGIVSDDKLLIEKQNRYDHDLSKEVLPQIVKIFKKVDLKPNDIDKIIVVDGPGSFTGIRIGITIAKVFAYSLGIKITTISSLEAMAVSSQLASFFVPIIDARRDYVFSAIYDNNMKVVMEPAYMKISSLKKELSKLDDFLIITNDVVKIDGIKEKYCPNILKIVNFYKNKKCINPHLVNPNYLKLTEAEETKK